VTVPAEPTRVTGSVSKLDRRGLPPATVITVQLEDVSAADAPADVLGETVVTTGGEQMPVPFAIGYDPAAITEGRRYVVRATVRVRDQLLYTSTEAHPVLTDGAPTTGIEIMVRPAS
jgi:putative lipoprotein